MADKQEEGYKHIRDMVEKMDVPGFDKAMGGVMREFEKECRGTLKARGGIIYCNLQSAEKFIPKACRSYARKVVDRIKKKRIYCSSQNWDYKLRYKELVAEIDNFTKKEPAFKPEETSSCPGCYSLTHTVNGKCGKCGKDKEPT